MSEFRGSKKCRGRDGHRIFGLLGNGACNGGGHSNFWHRTRREAGR